MSIWVRLIGGSYNGQVVKVDEDQVEQVMRERVPMQAASYRNFGIEPQSMSVRQSRYTRRTVRTPENEIVYFALEAMSDHEALQSVLGP